uniref:Uncharacterized protein n=1 Tax=Myoviridae sp. ct3wi9 TaxID=2826610 RepID=A0A8S5MWE1_9CAUD|nr:MAG TPA: hypothetical protein [Myoviridae sp. ct3wi9]
MGLLASSLLQYLSLVMVPCFMVFPFTTISPLA